MPKKKDKKTDTVPSLWTLYNNEQMLRFSFLLHHFLIQVFFLDLFQAFSNNHSNEDQEINMI